MKLREHPLLKKPGHRNGSPFSNEVAPIAGEIGVLDDVRPSRLSERCFFVLIDLRGTKYIGALTFGDDAFCRKFIDFVRRQRGKPIAKIAELDVSFG